MTLRLSTLCDDNPKSHHARQQPNAAHRIVRMGDCDIGTPTVKIKEIVREIASLKNANVAAEVEIRNGTY